MLGQKEKLSLGLKQFALFGAILGLVFGSGAFSYNEVFADDYDDWKKQYDEIKDKINHYKKKDKKKYKEWKKKLNDFKKKYNNYKVYVCHNGKDLKISIKALIAHLKHGDSKGKCDDDGDDDKKFKKGKVHTGDGPPPKKLGKKGDLYFDSWDDDSLEYYVKVGKKEWELRGTLVEPSNDCERGDVLKYNKVDNKWVCADDLVEDDDADPANELQDLEINGRELSLSDSSVIIPLPFAFDNQFCDVDEAVIGIDANGDVICGEVAGGLEEGSVTSLEIADGTIQSTDLDDESVTGPKIEEDSINNDHLQEDSVTSDKIEDGAITSDDLAEDAITFNVDIRTLSISKSIADESTGALSGSCSSNDEVITGFSVTNPDQDGPIGYESVSISGNSMSVSVINFASSTIDSWKLILYCTSVIPGEVTSSTSTGTGS